METLKRIQRNGNFQVHSEKMETLKRIQRNGKFQAHSEKWKTSLNVVKETTTPITYFYIRSEANVTQIEKDGPTCSVS